MAYRTDGTANFNFFINRQGPRGPQGIQGPEGFSPNVQVEEDHGNTFTLRVTNKDNFFITSNLREHKEDRGGTYIRYDRDTGVMYTGDADPATTDTLGVIRIAKDDDFTGKAEDTAVTPAQVQDYTTAKIAEVNQRIDLLDVNNVKVTGNQSIAGAKTFTDGIVTDRVSLSNGNSVLRPDAGRIKIGSTSNTAGTKLEGPDVEVRGTNVDIYGKFTAHGFADFNYNTTFYQDAIIKGFAKDNNNNLYLKQNTITAGDNVQIVNTADGIKISSTGGGSSEPPANMVTTDTEQTITGAKTLDNSLYVNNPDMMSGAKSISTEDLHCNSIELGRVWTSKNSDYIYANGYRRISAIAKNGVSIPMITCNTAGANPNIISFGVSDAYDVIIPARAKTYGGKKFLAQGSITAGSDNLLITETTDGVQITCNAPTNAQIEALQRLINDLSTKIDNLTNRVVALETQIDGGIA